jgi:hypothetical protein
MTESRHAKVMRHRHLQHVATLISAYELLSGPQLKELQDIVEKEWQALSTDEQATVLAVEDYEAPPNTGWVDLPVSEGSTLPARLRM